MVPKDFGKRFETIWNDLRPVTKELLVGALGSNAPTAKKSFAYDAHADWEISSLLRVLDDQVRKVDRVDDDKKLRELNNLADVCAGLLEARTESAEVFILLAKRALAKNDFKKIDALADALFERFKASEVSEVIRQTDLPQIRAIAFETLAVMPTVAIVPLLEDPLYFEIGCNVLEQQAVEFGSDDARRVLEHLETPNLRDVNI